MDKSSICKIRDIYRAISTLETQFESKFALNINEALLLCTLNEHAGSSSGELAQSMGLSNSNMSKVIRSVETKGLISRTFDSHDKRSIRFALTVQGTQRLAEMNCNEIQLPELLVPLVANNT